MSYARPVDADVRRKESISFRALISGSALISFSIPARKHGTEAAVSDRHSNLDMALPLDWALPLHDRNDPDINMSFNYLACRLPALIRRIQGCSVISKKASIISLPSGPVAVAIISLLSCFVAMAHAREGCPGAMPGAVLEKPME